MDCFHHLTDANFMMYAMKAYDNPHCLDIDEFHSDLKRIRYVRRLLDRYCNRGELNERLILNHIVILYNMFGPEATSRMLFFKIDNVFWPQLKSFLVYLNILPSRISGICDKDILISDIEVDGFIFKKLQGL